MQFKNAIIVCLWLLAPTLLYTQQTITWKGGTPGKETVWNEARNWDQHRLPNENDRVIIKLENNGHFAQPVIKGKAHVAWTEIYVGSSLYVDKTGTLLVDGEHADSEGISIYGGELVSDGKIILKDIDVEFIAAMQPICLNHKITYLSELYGFEFYELFSDDA